MLFGCPILTYYYNSTFFQLFGEQHVSKLNIVKLFFLVFALSFFYQLESQEFEMYRYTNQTVIVTGASKGIGKGLAKAYAREGARVVLVARSLAALEEVQSEILNAGGDAICITADISDPVAVQKLVDVTIERYGKIDVLCHNAGIYPERRLEEMQLEDWQAVIDVNLTGTFLTVSKCIPTMKAQGHGKIVVISSISGPKTALPGFSHYTASKGGVDGFIKSAAVELAKYNIQINTIEPGNILTESLMGLGEDYLASMTQAIPANRLGTPEDIACAALFLSSNETNFITGQSLVVDGGQVLPESHFSEF